MECRKEVHDAGIHRSRKRQSHPLVAHRGSLSVPAQHAGYRDGRQALTPRRGTRSNFGRRSPPTGGQSSTLNNTLTERLRGGHFDARLARVCRSKLPLSLKRAARGGRLGAASRTGMRSQPCASTEHASNDCSKSRDSVSARIRVQHDITCNQGATTMRPMQSTHQSAPRRMAE